MAGKYNKHIDEIMSYLGDDADRDEIEKEFMHYMEEFRLKPNDAKRAVAKKHGANLGGPSESEQKKISDLTALDNNVDLLCRVVFAADKRIKADGKEKDIVSGIIGDETGTTPFTLWEKGGLDLKKGDVINIEHAYVTEYKDQPQVNIGNRGKVTKMDRSAMPDVRGGDIGEAEQKAVKDLTPLDRNVNLMCCGVVFVTEKTIKADGKEKVILSGIIGDETGTVPFTVWEKGDLELAKGDAVSIEHAYVTEYREEPQVNVGNMGTVTKLDRSEMPEIKTRGAGPAKDVKIIDLGEANGNIAVVGRILNMETREVTVGGETKEVMSGTVADETGKVAFTCWGVMKIKEGDVVKVNNGYLRRWRGMPQLNFDAANAEKSKEKMPASEDLEAPAVVTIEYLSRVGGMVDAAVQGVVLDVRQGSGLVFRCPECKRVLQKGVCRVHGEKEGTPDLRTKAVIDDGTGAMTAILGRDISERLLGKSLDKCLKEAQKAMDQGVIVDQLFEKLVARHVCITGNVTSDDFGLMLIATSTEFTSADPQAEARKILEEIA